MLFAKILPRAQRACTFDISADRYVWLQPALRSFAIVCDYMETALFAICDHMETSLKGGSKGFQHLEDTLFRSNDATTLYHVTAMLWYHMKNRLFSKRCDHYCDVKRKKAQQKHPIFWI